MGAGPLVERTWAADIDDHVQSGRSQCGHYARQPDYRIGGFRPAQAVLPHGSWRVRHKAGRLCQT
jgi:hypothetical protein